MALFHFIGLFRNRVVLWTLVVWLDFSNFVLVLFDFFREPHFDFLLFDSENIIKFFIKLNNKFLHFQLLLFSELLKLFDFFQIERNFILVPKLFVLIFIQLEFYWLIPLLCWLFLCFQSLQLFVKLLNELLTNFQIFHSFRLLVQRFFQLVNSSFLYRVPPLYLL